MCDDEFAVSFMETLKLPSDSVLNQQIAEFESLFKLLHKNRGVAAGGGGASLHLSAVPPRAWHAAVPSSQLGSAQSPADKARRAYKRKPPLPAHLVSSKEEVVGYLTTLRTQFEGATLKIEFQGLDSNSAPVILFHVHSMASTPLSLFVDAGIVTCTTKFNVRAGEREQSAQCEYATFSPRMQCSHAADLRKFIGLVAEFYHRVAHAIDDIKSKGPSPMFWEGLSSLDLPSSALEALFAASTRMGTSCDLKVKEMAMKLQGYTPVAPTKRRAPGRSRGGADDDDDDDDDYSKKPKKVRVQPNSSAGRAASLAKSADDALQAASAARAILTFKQTRSAGAGSVPDPAAYPYVPASAAAEAAAIARRAATAVAQTLASMPRARQQSTLAPAIHVPPMPAAIMPPMPAAIMPPMPAAIMPPMPAPIMPPMPAPIMPSTPAIHVPQYVPTEPAVPAQASAIAQAYMKMMEEANKMERRKRY
jgi:hypothetical protein